MRDRHGWAFGAKSAAVVAVLVFALYIRDIAASAGIKVPALPMAYGSSSMDNLLAAGVTILAVFALKSRTASASAIRLLGLGMPEWRASALVLLGTLPVWIYGAMTYPMQRPPDLQGLLFTAVLFPLAEELVFRGFGFVFARTGLGWRLGPALLMQAVCFGGIHWFDMRGSDMAVPVLVMTFIGGLLFGVLDVLNRYTIWCGLIFHISLNAAWGVFDFSSSASGGWGWTDNLWRLTSALLALCLLWRARTSGALMTASRAGG